MSGTQLLFSGDHHWDHTKRWEECQRVHAFMVNEAARLKVDGFVSCGDVYERASTPEERQGVAAWLQAMAEICPVFVVRGNHDRKLDCALMARLSSKHPIRVCESVDVVHVRDVAIGLCAWPDRAGVIGWADAQGVAPELAAADLYRALLTGLGQQLAAHDGPRIVAGHFMINGALTSTGQPLIGQSLELSLRDLDMTQAHAVVAAHIHKPQEWVVSRTCPVFYTGSPYRTAYGETEQKSILLATVVQNQTQRIDFDRIPTPCAHMHLIEEEWDGFDFARQTQDDWIAPERVAGSEIRLRYHVPTDDRPAAAAVAEAWKASWLAMGAANVKVEESVQAHSAARAPEVAQAVTLADKLCALWNARQTMPEPAHKARLLHLADGLADDS